MVVPVPVRVRVPTVCERQRGLRLRNAGRRAGSTQRLLHATTRTAWRRRERVPHESMENEAQCQHQQAERDAGGGLDEEFATG